MDATKDTPQTDKEAPAESIDSDDRHLFDDELASGTILAEAFFEPEHAAVSIEHRGDGLLSVQLREATNSRGLTTNWLLTPDDARAVADRLATLADEVADRTDEQKREGGA